MAFATDPRRIAQTDLSDRTRQSRPIMQTSPEKRRTLLAVSITADTAQEMQEQAAKAAQAGADLVELRLDWLGDLSGSAVRFLLANKPRPAIATIRASWEGGRFRGSEEERLQLLKAAVRAGADYIDLEHAAWRQAAEIRQEIAEARNAHGGRTVRLIVSKHDFEATPEDLGRIFRELATTEADIVKVATHAGHICDALRMLEAVRQAAKPAIGLCMGPAGVASRILAPKAAAALTFCSLESGAEAAPGQVPIAEMLGMYRFHMIGPDTPVLGVVGHPVGHSMSPALHNAAYRQMGIDAVYLPLHVAAGAESFGAFIEAIRQARWLGFRGLSVTIPHKLHALRCAECKEPLAVKIGAANTLLLQDDGTISAYNTDYAAAVAALCEGAHLQRCELAGKSAAVLGAGGVSRAVVAGLIDAGCNVTIYNRTFEKARNLAEQFGCEVATWQDRLNLKADLVVNCTSLGMWPQTDVTPLPAEALAAGMIVFDTVYNPPQTRLLREAAERGCTVVDGVAMFVHQAALQMQRWFERSGAFDTMRQIVLERLRRQ